MGKVLWHVTMPLDGFIAGPNDSMDWVLEVFVVLRSLDFRSLDFPNRENYRYYSQFAAVVRP
jgi:hypothetical protein